MVGWLLLFVIMCAAVVALAVATSQPRSRQRNVTSSRRFLGGSPDGVVDGGGFDSGGGDGGGGE